MKILVIGGSGMIGNKLFNYFKESEWNTEFTYHTNVVPFAQGHRLDITQKKSTINLITKLNPDVVIHTAALANVDLCETNNSLAYSVNVQGTANVVEGCKKVDSRLVYISTSFVFDGSRGQYTEDDQASPSTYYGLTKLEGEEITKRSGLQYLILRTDQPYCWVENWQRTNSVIRVIQAIQAKKIHKEIIDWYNTPTYVPDFVFAVDKLLHRNEEGTYHLVGPDFINRYEWSILAAKIFGLDKNMIKPIRSDELTLAAKRVNVNLSNQKLTRQTNIPMRGVKDGLLDMKKNSKT